MKKIIILIIVIAFFSNNVHAQYTNSSEKYGKTLNIGLGMGIGNYGYTSGTIPVVHANYEFDVAKTFTLAPFISVYSYKNNYYRETIIPVGVKGFYYFDQLVNANSKWDFYLAGSLGVAIKKITYENGYDAQTTIYHGPGSLYLDFSIGTEYHFSNKIGAFIDLSGGISTIGLAFHN
ncbi:hypothetical protein GALL_121090 [mine drainage metagenome]|uniref:Outer membrane protein beta-barrel domain-containing protein n=1 Tax=mine drainage metagenome TaxID=410659 RepID=A0A1J5SBS6_9ZZZZ